MMRHTGVGRGPSERTTASSASSAVGPIRPWKRSWRPQAKDGTPHQRSRWERLRTATERGRQRPWRWPTPGRRSPTGSCRAAGPARAPARSSPATPLVHTTISLARRTSASASVYAPLRIASSAARPRWVSASFAVLPVYAKWWANRSTGGRLPLALEVLRNLLVQLLSETEAQRLVCDVANHDVTEQVCLLRRWRVGHDEAGTA